MRKTALNSHKFVPLAAPNARVPNGCKQKVVGLQSCKRSAKVRESCDAVNRSEVVMLYQHRETPMVHGSWSIDVSIVLFPLGSQVGLPLEVETPSWSIDVSGRSTPFGLFWHQKTPSPSPDPPSDCACASSTASVTTSSRPSTGSSVRPKLPFHSDGLQPSSVLAPSSDARSP